MSGQAGQVDWSRWLPFLLSVAVIGSGGLLTAGWMQNETAALRRDMEAMKAKREADRELLIEIRADVKQLKRDVGVKNE
jgi:hypothetical protein